MPISKLGKLSQEEVRKAVGIVKSEKPDLWEKLVEHERAGNGRPAFGLDLQRVVWPHFRDLRTSDLAFLIFEIRMEARREGRR